MSLNTIWFALFGVLIAGYALLDGFDLGVGILHLFARNDHEKRIHLNAIGPVWDGNEVWLLTGGGALFAAFPMVYATVFSGFYLALMLILLALIGRAVAMEFRGKHASPRWRGTWDVVFGIGSLLPALLFGVAVGNILQGIPIDAQGHYTGTFFTLLRPYPLLVGLLGLFMFLQHGALYLRLKSDGELADRLDRLVPRLWMVFVILLVLATLLTFFFAPRLMDGVFGRPLFWPFFLAMLAGVFLVPAAAQGRRPGRAFLGSCLAIAGMIGVAAVGLFPVLVPSTLDPAWSLTAFNASSSQRTLRVMLIIALVGMPIVIAYTIYVYRVFAGRTEIGEGSY